MASNSVHSARGGFSLKPPFGDLLVAKGLVQASQWEEAQAQGTGEFTEAVRVLVGRGWLEESALLEELSAYTGLPLAAGRPKSKSSPVEGLTYQFLKANKVVPLNQSDGVLEMAVVDPFRWGVLEGVGRLTGLKVRPFIAAEEWVLRRVESEYGLGSHRLESWDERSLPNLDATSVLGDLSNLEDLSSEAPVIRLLNFLVDRAAALGVSDIHLEPQEHHLRVRYRIDGSLQEKERLDIRFHAPLTSRIKIMAKLNIAERRLPQDGQIMLKVAGRNLDLRISTLPTSFGESVVMRLLYRDTLSWELSGLGVGSKHLETLIRLIERPHGLLLVTGPTGSGKTTTLYCALKQIITPEKKTLTIEDPVEYRLPGVNQIQVNSQIGLTFAAGLRSILRQDPDIILVGEIRDSETASIAIHAALTGHMVFSTLHTNDAPGAITRLQDMGIDSFLISSALTAVIAQRLARKLCPHCKAPTQINGEMLAQHGIMEEPGLYKVYRAQGCEACSQQGYAGRSAIFELLQVSDPVRDLINDRAHTEEIRRQASKEGMLSLRQDGWQRVKQGVTSFEELLRVTAV